MLAKAISLLRRWKSKSFALQHAAILGGLGGDEAELRLGECGLGLQPRLQRRRVPPDVDLHLAEPKTSRMHLAEHTEI